LWKNAVSRNVEESSKTFLDPDSEADDFKNVISSSLSTDRGATAAGKLRETKVWVPTPERLRPAPGQRPGWVLGAGVGRPLPL